MKPKNIRCCVAFKFTLVLMFLCLLAGQAGAEIGRGTSIVENDLDDDGDGSANGQELIDGSADNDPDSYVEHAGYRYCLWGKRFLPHTKRFLQLQNAGCGALSLRVDQYDTVGTVLKTKVLTLENGKQTRVSLKKIASDTGKGYGQTCATIVNGDPDSLLAQIIDYQPNRKNFRYAQTLPYSLARSGRQFVSYNQSFPDLSSMPKEKTVRFLSIVSGSSVPQTGTLRFYDHSGNLIKTSALEIAADARKNLAVPDSSKAGFVQWQPDASDAEFQLSFVTYTLDSSGSRIASFTVPANRPAGAARAAPFIAEPQSKALLQLSNVLDSEVSVDLKIIKQSGKTFPPVTLKIAARNTLRINLNRYLKKGHGAVEVQSPSAEALLATLLYYGVDSESQVPYSNAINLMSGTGNTSEVLYDNSTGKCSLLLANLSESAQTVLLSVTDSEGQTVVDSDPIPLLANSTLRKNVCSKIRKGSGRIRISPEIPGKLVGILEQQSTRPETFYQTPLSGRSICTAALNLSVSTSLGLTQGGGAEDLTINNTSTSVTAEDIQVTLPDNWSDVSVDASNCSQLLPQASCNIQFTPGSSTHAAAEIMVQGANTTRTFAQVSVNPPTTATIQVSPSSRTLLAYGSSQSVTVTNTSTILSALNISATLPTGWTDVTQDASACVTLLPLQSCQLHFTPGTTQYSAQSILVSGSNTSSATVQLEVDPPTATTLVASLSNLALVANDTATNPALTGSPRQIVFTNSGSDTAHDLAVNVSSLPSGTTVSSNTCGATLAASSSCVLTITPGTTATSDGSNPCTSGTAPVPTVISLSGTNTNTVTTNVVVLSYGCIYQGGYLFAVDDSTPGTSSIGGKVASLADQAGAFPSGIVWGSDSGGSVNFVNIPGITEISTTISDNCNGATDGACNTTEIVDHYNLINISFYAAGVCQQTINTFSDWFLPSICELGYDTSTNGTSCGTSVSPTLQNMQTSLVDNGSLNILSGFYWSSTQWSVSPTNQVWTQFFANAGGSAQTAASKGLLVGVRCIRSLS